MIFNKFLPNEYSERIFDIDLQQLIDDGIKGIITDLDNTLVAWDEKDATEEVSQWIKRVERLGIKIVIISNNNEERVKRFAEPLGVPFLPVAKKPMKRTF